MANEHASGHRLTRTLLYPVLEVRRIVRTASTSPRHGWIVLAVVLAGVVVAGFGLTQLTFTADNRVFFKPDDPDLQDLERLQATFSQNHNVVIAVEPLRGEVFTPNTLAIVAEITDRAWQLPYSSRVDSLTNYQHSHAEDDDFFVQDLVPPDATLTPEELARLQAIALAAPEVRGRLLSPAADVTAVIVTFRLPEFYTRPVREIAGAVRALAADVERDHPEVKLHLTGQVMVMATFGEASRADMGLLVPIMLLLIVLSAALILRSVWGTLAVVSVCVLAAIATIGIAGWFGHVINPTTAIAPTVILTLGIADGVHIVTGVLASMRADALRHDAVRVALRQNWSPIMFTALCTAVGFFALNGAESPPLNQIGSIVGGGALIAAALSLTYLPALLTVLPLKPPAHPGPNWAVAVEWLVDFVVRNRHAALAVAGLFTVVLSLGVFRLDINDMWLKYFDDRFAFRRDTDFVQQRLSGVELIEFALPAAGEGGISDPNYLKAVDAFATWLRAQPEVTNVLSVSDIVRRLNRNMNGDDPRFDVIPDNKTLISQYLLLYEMSLPFGLDLGDQIDIARTTTRLSVALKERTTRELREFVSRAETWLAQNAPAIAARPTGISIIFAHISERNIRSMLLSIAGSLVLVSGLLVLALRSLRLSLLSLVPNLLPPVIAFGVWGWLIGEVNLAAAIVASVTFGIVVDDTVHILTHYHEARHRGAEPVLAIRRAMVATGPAAATTTVTLTVGFLLLGLSGFQLNQTMGLLTAITMVVALLFDWFMLPPLLLLFDRRRFDPRRAHDASAPAVPGSAAGHGANARTERT